MAALATFLETFNTVGAPDAGKWLFENAATTGSCTQTGGTLHFTYGSATGACYLTSVSAYDLTGSSAYVKLVAPATTPSGLGTAGTTSGFMLMGGTDPANEYLICYQTSDNNMWFVASNTTSGVFWNSPYTYSTATFAWFRIRESGGTIYMDSAPSTASNPPAPSDWVNRTALPLSSLGWAGAGITAVKVRLQSAQTVDFGSAAPDVQWDALNTTAGSGPSTYNETRTESAIINHTQTAAAAFNRVITETAVISHSQTSAMVYARTVSEAAAISDLVNGAPAFSGSVTETATLSDSRNSSHAYTSTASENFSVADACASTMFWEPVNTQQNPGWTQVST